MKECKLLIVEDEIISIQYLKLILSNLGYENVYSATNASSALKICKKTKIDLVFMDINLEGSEDGIHCAIKLNKEYFVPIIFTTAYDDSLTISDCLDANIFGYILKPYEQAHIESTLLMALKRIKVEKNRDYLLKNNSQDTIINLGKDQLYNLSKNTFFNNNNYVNLTKIELDLLNILVKNINGNTSYEVLRKNVWKDKSVGDSAIRDVISRLKKRLQN